MFKTLSSILPKPVMRTASRLAVAGGVVFGLSMADVPADDRNVARSDGRSAVASDHPLAPALKLAHKSVATASQLTDYECVFSKREVVGGRIVSQQMAVKIRHEPFSVYIKYIEPYAGREAIYVEGANDGNLLAHGTGLEALVGTLRLNPKGETAMEDNKYPVMMMGMVNTTSELIKQWERETKFGEVDVKYYRNAKIRDGAGKEIECEVAESTHPVPRNQFRFHRSRLFIDKATGLPVRIEQFGFPRTEGGKSPMLEQYTFTRIRSDVGLKAIDFDIENPKYDF